MTGTPSLPLVRFARIAARDLFGGRRRVLDPRVHLLAAADWLERAHDVSSDDGVSYGFSLRGGWKPSYRETSGYIAVTFFDLCRKLERPAFRDRAIRVVRWLVGVQNADGSYSNPAMDAGRGIVFDTGQVLLGLTRAHEETGDEDFLAAARRAGAWLTRVADERGHWTRNTHLGVQHTYNTRVAWALLRLASLAPDSDAERVARANLDWALEQEHDGWFEKCAFEHHLPPFTHTIAYAIRGLLESGLLLDEPRYVQCAERAARAVIGHVRADGFVPGRIDSTGRAMDTSCCLTGNCQLSIVWAKLFGLTGDEPFRRAALDSLRYVMSCQDTTTPDPDVRGAIKGSQPIWGRYSRLTYPNWATKFFIDAVLLCEGWS